MDTFENFSSKNLLLESEDISKKEHYYYDGVWYDVNLFLTIEQSVEKLIEQEGSPFYQYALLYPDQKKRCLTVLEQNEIHTLGQLVSLQEVDILKFKRSGKKVTEFALYIVKCYDYTPGEIISNFKESHKSFQKNFTWKSRYVVQQHPEFYWKHLGSCPCNRDLGSARFRRCSADGFDVLVELDSTTTTIDHRCQYLCTSCYESYGSRLSAQHYFSAPQKVTL